MRDYQRERVYRAEREAEAKLHKAGNIFTLSTDEATEMVASVCRKENILVPELKFERKRERQDGKWVAGEYDYETNALKLVDPIYDTTVIHELAHVATAWLWPRHGIEWVQNYLRMLRRWCDDHCADVMFERYAAHGVHMDAHERVQRVKRVAVNMVNRQGKPKVELLLAGVKDPLAPTWVEGRLTEVTPRSIVIDDHAFNIRRARYIERVA